MSKYNDEYIRAAREDAKRQYDNTIKKINECELRYARAIEKFKAIGARLQVLENEYIAAKSRYEKYSILYEEEKKILDSVAETYNNTEANKAAALEQYENRLKRLEDK